MWINQGVQPSAISAGFIIDLRYTLGLCIVNVNWGGKRRQIFNYFQFQNTLPQTYNKQKSVNRSLFV